MILLKEKKPEKKVTEFDLIQHVEEVLSDPEREMKKQKIWEALSKEMGRGNTA